LWYSRFNRQGWQEKETVDKREEQILKFGDPLRTWSAAIDEVPVSDENH